MFYFLIAYRGIVSILFMIAINKHDPYVVKLGSLIYKCAYNILNYDTSSIDDFRSSWLNLLDFSAEL